MSVGHILCQAETRAGKSKWANALHRRWPRVSIFWNPNEVRWIHGVRVRSVNSIARVLASGRKVNFIPSSDEATARAQLHAIVQKLLGWGRGVAEDDVWAQFVLDEGHEWAAEAALKTLATRGLGAFGIRLIVLTQAPKEIPTTVRTNLWTRVFFRPGLEGLQFLAQKGYPWRDIERWTTTPHSSGVCSCTAADPTDPDRFHFCYIDQGRQIEYRTPISASAL